jgi:hypothetical protein
MHRSQKQQLSPLLSHAGALLPLQLEISPSNAKCWVRFGMPMFRAMAVPALQPPKARFDDVPAV